MFNTFSTGKPAIVVGQDNRDGTDALRNTLEQRHSDDPTVYSDAALYRAVPMDPTSKLRAQAHHIIPVDTAETFKDFFNDVL